MDQRQYATVDDYTEFNGKTTTDAMLRRASSTIDTLTRLARREVDDDGYPLDAAIADAYQRATCAQVEWFADNGNTSGASPKYQAMSLGSLSLSRGAKNSAIESTASSRYSPEAIEILQGAGLMSKRVSHV